MSKYWRRRQNSVVVSVVDCHCSWRYQFAIFSSFLPTQFLTILCKLYAGFSHLHNQKKQQRERQLQQQQISLGRRFLWGRRQTQQPTTTTMTTPKPMTTTITTQQRGHQQETAATAISFNGKKLFNINKKEQQRQTASIKNISNNKRQQEQWQRCTEATTYSGYNGQTTAATTKNRHSEQEQQWSESIDSDYTMSSVHGVTLPAMKSSNVCSNSREPILFWKESKTARSDLCRLGCSLCSVAVVAAVQFSWSTTETGAASAAFVVVPSALVQAERRAKRLYKIRNEYFPRQSQQQKRHYQRHPLCRSALTITHPSTDQASSKVWIDAFVLKNKKNQSRSRI